MKRLASLASLASSSAVAGAARNGVRRFAAGRAAFALAVFALGGAAAAPLAGQDLAVRGRKVYPVSGPVLDDGVVIVRGGKIVAVGLAADVPIPAGLKVLEAAVVTPGLVDAHTTVGFSGYLNQPHDQDQVDPTGPVQPELRAIDAYNARERLIEWVRGFGVTTIHTGHGPLALVAGQTMVTKTRGDSVEKAVIVPRAMLAATLGAAARAEGRASPGTAAKQLAMLREALLGAEEYRKKIAAAGDDAAKLPPRDLRQEALVEVLERKVPLMITAQRHQDLLSALRLAKEFGFRLVLDGAAEAHAALEEIKAAAVPVIAHPPMARFESELRNASRTTPKKLLDAGIPFALQSGYEAYVPKTRVVLYEAAVAAAYGLGAEAALKSITLDAATILGVQERVGSLAVGKDGDLALYDGDPFEYVTRCVGTVVEGVVHSSTPR
jgi:imidazolonepropionase-like amidohydrolase